MAGELGVHSVGGVPGPLENECALERSTNELLNAHHTVVCPSRPSEYSEGPEPDLINTEGSISDSVAIRQANTVESN